MRMDGKQDAKKKTMLYAKRFKWGKTPRKKAEDKGGRQMKNGTESIRKGHGHKEFCKGRDTAGKQETNEKAGCIEKNRQNLGGKHNRKRRF